MSSISCSSTCFFFTFRLFLDLLVLIFVSLKALTQVNGTSQTLFVAVDKSPCFPLYGLDFTILETVWGVLHCCLSALLISILCGVSTPPIYYANHHIRDYPPPAGLDAAHSVRSGLHQQSIPLMIEDPHQLSLTFAPQPHRPPTNISNPTAGACGVPLSLYCPTPNFQRLQNSGFTRIVTGGLRHLSISTVHSRVFPNQFANGPRIIYMWAWPNIISTADIFFFGQPISLRFVHFIYKQLTMGLVLLTRSKIFEGFLEIYFMRVLPYHFFKNCSVGSSTLELISSSSATEESISLPYLWSMRGEVSSVLLPSVCSSLLTGLLPCVAVCTGPEGTIKITLVFLVSEDWFSTSQYKVTKSQLPDSVVKASSTHSSIVLFSLSTSYEELSCLIFFAIVVNVYVSRRCLIPSCVCNASN